MEGSIWTPVQYLRKSDLDSAAGLPVTVDCVPGFNGIKWAVRRGKQCLNKNGVMEFEPLPSSRDEAFYRRCRWDSRGEAIMAADRYLAPKGGAHL